jgi:hypothetical protein
MRVRFQTKDIIWDFFVCLCVCVCVCVYWHPLLLIITMPLTLIIDVTKLYLI